MKSNRLHSNPDNAEVLWRATNRRQHHLPTTSLTIDGAAVDTVKSVRDLGIDADLDMRTYVQRTAYRYFAALRQLRHIRCSVPPATFQSLVVTLMLKKTLYWSAFRPINMPSTVGTECDSTVGMRSADHITDALAFTGYESL